MPKLGAVNERRNQLHEVIRLSGINVTINDADHPLIVKVASMQHSRIQVYFVDNDDYFQKLDEDIDAIGSNRTDNDERIIFFSRGTIDTARKLRWDTNFLHASGWISSLVPLYVKRVFSDGTSFINSKIIYSILDEAPIAPIASNLFDKLKADGFKDEEIGEFLEMEPCLNTLHKMGIAYADAVIFNNRKPDSDLLEYAQKANIPVLILNPEEDNFEKYHEFYQALHNQ